MINELLDFKSRVESQVLDRHGLQIKNLGAGTDLSDAVTLAQIQGMARSSDIPDVARVDHFSSIIWSHSGTPVAGDIIPPYCIVNLDKVGQPTAVWLAASVAGTGSMSVNIKLNGVSILASSLTLNAGAVGPSQTSFFVSPIPTFGIGTTLIPTIVSVGGQVAISIGMTIRKQKRSPLL